MQSNRGMMNTSEPITREIYEQSVTQQEKKSVQSEIEHSKLEDHISSLQNLAMQLLKDENILSSLKFDNQGKAKGAALKAIDENAKKAGEMKMEESRVCCCFIL